MLGPHPGSVYARTGQAAGGGLRAAFYRHAFSRARAGADPRHGGHPPLAWAQHHSLPLPALSDPQVTRRALDALALRLDGTRAAAAAITCKRAVFHNCLGYAIDAGLLSANPLDRITVRSPYWSQAITESRPHAKSCLMCIH